MKNISGHEHKMFTFPCILIGVVENIFGAYLRKTTIIPKAAVYVMNEVYIILAVQQIAGDSTIQLGKYHYIFCKPLVG